jgi:hypothetical protein
MRVPEPSGSVRGTEGFVKHEAGVAPDLAAALAQATPIAEEAGGLGQCSSYDRMPSTG